MKKIALLIILLSLTPTKAYADNHKVIYGEDNRVEVDEFGQERFVQASEAVAAMVWNKKLLSDFLNPDTYNFKKLSLRLSYNICEEERFSDQVPLSNCTGFLVAPDIVVTAGHCIKSQTGCKENTWVFGYTLGTQIISKANSYSCKKVIERKLIDSGTKVQDYAVIQLDRPVLNRTPLPIRTRGHLKTKTPIVVIGHPMGLPMKIADHAKVSGFSFGELLKPYTSYLKRKNYFITNTDTYMGNSGSPVFNQNTGEVEGILIQGATDFQDTTEGCMISKRYLDKSKNRNEKVFRILKVENLKQIIQDSYKRLAK
ncbi:hypothetical protein A9Q84_13085 [Halobacteriovorax marinus]|uniref:Serine protease n=1 Tax=Halobacteriovorax marinus TaxID=97084 RepID=A0A1Y5F8Z1_9BACT|nr:hypothetical protein A9Q84_13085 [Halobacteriovorax marinus]